MTGYVIPPPNVRSLSVDVTGINSEVEVANDTGSPVPVVGPVTDAQLRATPVQVADAAEDAGLIAAPFTLTATGAGQVLVAAPGGGGLLRLRRLSPTYAIRSPDSEPILSLKVGAVEAQRGNALTGRFDITAAADTDAITLDVDVLDTGGRVAGTVYYEVI